MAAVFVSLEDKSITSLARLDNVAPAYFICPNLWQYTRLFADYLLRLACASGLAGKILTTIPRIWLRSTMPKRGLRLSIDSSGLSPVTWYPPRASEETRLMTCPKRG